MWGISFSQLEQFIFIFIRIGAIMMLAPVFGYRSVPLRCRIGFSLLLAYLLFPIVYDVRLYVSPQLVAFAMAVIQEVVIGLIIGFATTLLFAGVQLSGQIIGIQMGFTIANIIDPQSQMQTSVISQFKYLLVLFIFLAIDGHHFLLRATAASFEAIPLLKVTLSDTLISQIIRMSAEVIVIGIKIGAPTMASLLLVEMGMGIIARAVPQMNIFIVGLPLKIGIGLLALGTSLYFVAYLFGKLLIASQSHISALLRIL